MGGTVIETESERLLRVGKREGILEGKREGILEGERRGKAQMLIEMSQENGQDNATILKKLQDKIDLTLEQAAAYLEQYGRQTV